MIKPSVITGLVVGKVKLFFLFLFFGNHILQLQKFFFLKLNEHLK